jgi:hypothetical protein
MVNSPPFQGGARGGCPENNIRNCEDGKTIQNEKIDAIYVERKKKAATEPPLSPLLKKEGKEG